MTSMTVKNNGFTMIELVMVIVIIGIITAVAIPKFINIKADAHRETLEGVAGALSSASAINYGARAVDGTKGDPIANCIDVALALQSGLPNGYTITSAGIGPGDTVSCIVSDDTSGDTTTFTGLGVR
jgi:MSHA pilin protein MshA